MSGGRPRRVAVTHRYFWPQNYPYAAMAREIVEALVAQGHDVEVLTTASGTPDERPRRADWARDHGVEVREVDVGDVRTVGGIGRVLSHVRYAAWLASQLVRRRPDVTWVASTPPVLAGAAVRWASRATGGRYVYHVQDVHPEAVSLRQAESGVATGLGLARALDRRTVEDAAVTIVLSEDMRATLERRGLAPSTTIRVVNNFVRVPDIPEALVPIRPGDPFRLLFAGGIGRFQRLEQVLAVVAEFAPDEGVTLDVMGDGPERARLEEEWGGLPTVRFLGQRPRAEAHAAMCRASCGVVSLLPGVTTVAWPSKVIDYRAFGLPVWAMVDVPSGLARDLEGRGDGWAVRPGADPATAAAGLRAFRARLEATPPNRDALAAGARRRVTPEYVVPRLLAAAGLGRAD